MRFSGHWILGREGNIASEDEVNRGTGTEEYCADGSKDKEAYDIEEGEEGAFALVRDRPRNREHILTYLPGL